MNVRELINILMYLELSNPIVIWEQGCIYPIQITRKNGYYVISADKINI